jgi:glycosyltransferase involved in cell wall biosynthesis
MRLAIITSHPIQYNAPWFRLLAQTGRVRVKVFYTWEQSAKGDNHDPGFGKVIKWDIPLLDGYEYTFVKNISTDPGTHHFKGIINPSLISEVVAWKAEAILVFGWSFKSHLGAMRFFHGKVPVLFRGDSTLLDEQTGIKKLLRRIFLKWVYRHIDHALYVGTNNKAYFKALGLKDNQLVFSPHAIDNSRFIDEEGDYALRARDWRKELGFKDDDIVVLFAGKLEPKKNPGIILKVAARVSDIRLKFLLVGNGELEEELKKEAAALSNVRFLDFQNQQLMPVVYRLGDIFLLPSVGPGETWGLALNEAMAAGRAVIASDKVGGAIDLIQSGENGYIFSNRSVDALYEQLLKACSNFKPMGKRSEALILSWNFTGITNSIYSILKVEK